MNAAAGDRPDAKEHFRHLEASEALFRQGDPAVAIFRLQSGRVRLLRQTEDGSSVVMHVARPGETFAEAALILVNVLQTGLEEVAVMAADAA